MTALVHESAYGLSDSGLLETLEQKVEYLIQDVQQLKQTVATLQNKQTSQCNGPIAFTARLERTIENMGSHQHIVFDNVLTNLGNAYSPQHGHFTATVNGAYIFFVMVTNKPQHSASIFLMKNGQDIGHALAHGSSSDSGLFVTSTIAVTVHLFKGDQVWVQNEGAYSTVEELDGNEYSIFSGHLISAN